jgi:hypothetical protein
VIEKIADTGY